MHGIRSPGYATDLIFPHHDGIIEDRGDYLCIKTPGNPDYMWGNFLLFKGHPKLSPDFGEWARLYRSHFGDDAWFMTFGWDGELPESQLTEFTQNGFQLEETAILELRSATRPMRFLEGLSVRPMVTDEDWKSVAESHVEHLCSGPHRDEQARFERNRFESYRRLSRKGVGHWFGADFDGERIADMGVFVDGNRGRFQEVLTYPRWRKMGVCRAMVYLSCRWMKDRYSVPSFITLADDPDAVSAYRSVGFESIGKSQGLRWFDLSARS